MAGGTRTAQISCKYMKIRIVLTPKSHAQQASIKNAGSSSQL
jgi:hypothetical protein